MILTLHLTESCNMDCSYCVREKTARDMSTAVLDAACRLIFSRGRTAGFSFFGGEPLLKKDLVLRALRTCVRLSGETGIPFDSKLTTNGTLLDEAFLEQAVRYPLTFGISFDGLGQDLCRRTVSGEGTLALVEKKAKLLLSYLPRSYGMMTIAPPAAGTFADSVRYLYSLGFRRITATIALGRRVSWTDEAMEEISCALTEISEFYFQCIRRGDPFFFSPFDGKIRDALGQGSPAERCHLGKRQFQAAVDGRLYACTQFLGDPDYCVGDVFTGPDPALLGALAERSLSRPEPADCMACALRSRCTHTCGCSNRLETGDENLVSPVQCTYEQLLIACSDALADRILAYDEAYFTEKFRKP